MSALDRLILYIKRMDDYQLELVLAFIAELFDLDLND